MSFLQSVAVIESALTLCEVIVCVCVCVCVCVFESCMFLVMCVVIVCV